MKKRILAMIFAAFMALAMAGCGSNTSNNDSTDSGSASAQTTTQGSATSAPASESSTKDFSGDYEDTGSGTITVSTPSGTSEDGNVPVLFVGKDDMLVQISLDTEELDGGKLSYIYIDGMLSTKEQLADSQIPLDLSGDSLSAGTHTVEVVQYDTDEPTGEVVTYKSAAYEVKEK